MNKERNVEQPNKKGVARLLPDNSRFLLLSSSPARRPVSSAPASSRLSCSFSCRRRATSSSKFAGTIPWSTKLTTWLHTAARSTRLTSPLPILVGQPPIEVEKALFLSTHLGRLLPGFRPKPIHLRGQGLVLGHNALNLVEAPFPVLRRFHCALQEEHVLNPETMYINFGQSKRPLPLTSSTSRFAARSTLAASSVSASSS